METKNNLKNDNTLSDYYLKLLYDFLGISKNETILNYNLNEFIEKNYDLYIKKKLKIINGNILYCCNIVMNVFEGNGIVIFPGGFIYDGMFSNGFPNLYGKFLHPDKSYYIGEWKNGIRNGKGSYLESNGNKYVGEWINNMKHGEGKLYEKDKIYYVLYKNNIIIKKENFSSYLLQTDSNKTLDVDKKINQLTQELSVLSEKFFLEQKKNSLIETENSETVNKLEKIIIEKEKIINKQKNKEIENELEKYKILNEEQTTKINNFQKEYDLAISQYSVQIDNYEKYIVNLKNHYEDKLTNLRTENINTEKTLDSKSKSLEDLKKKHNCKICLSGEANIITIPCKHLVMCSFCEDEHSRISGPVCPVCRGTYYDRIRIYR